MKEELIKNTFSSDLIVLKCSFDRSVHKSLSSMKILSSSSISFMVLMVIISFLSSSLPAYGDNLVDFPEILQEKSYLSLSYYNKRCPDLDKIIHNKVNEWVKNDSTIAASLMRLHFHDCAVRGCDASILLNHAGSEREAAASKSLRGFQLIDDIKTEVENACPKTVSCADILTAAARDAARKVGVPFWDVPYGRKDGKVSIAKEADEQVPMGREDITTLIEFFQARGMNLLDLVVLSGAHTMGRTTCGVIQHRLYNFKGTHKTDPSIDEKYANFLKRKCRWQSEYVDLDATTPNKFDAVYYKNLQKKMGLLSSDQLLYSDPRTAPLVNALASQPDLFKQQFVVSMVKLGNTQVLTGRHQGEIRTKCSSVNSANANQKKY